MHTYSCQKLDYCEEHVREDGTVHPVEMCSVSVHNWAGAERDGNGYMCEIKSIGVGRWWMRNSKWALKVVCVHGITSNITSMTNGELIHERREKKRTE